MSVEAFAPAKVNLTLHVTGQRADGYHMLDSLVMFADIGDRVRVSASSRPVMVYGGPMADQIPTDGSNLVARAADMMGVSATIRLEKALPPAAGLGGGSSDAAAVLRALHALTGAPMPKDVLPLGADVPVCLYGKAARMQGVGDVILPAVKLPELHAVLVNPRIPVLTAEVFKRLKKRDNPPMPVNLPRGVEMMELVDWLREMRNDLEAPAIEAEPVIETVFNALQVTPGCLLTRMSGSGGTCFGLYADAETAASAAGRMAEEHPNWWVAATRLNHPDCAPLA